MDIFNHNYTNKNFMNIDKVKFASHKEKTCLENK